MREDLRERTKRFALRIIRVYGALPQETVAQVLGKQVFLSGTSVGPISARRTGHGRTVSLWQNWAFVCRS